MNLKKINEKFLDRFIRLESLCAKRFGVVTAGVTEYISRLNRAEHADGRDEALRQLNRYRSLRNKMVHEEGALRSMREINKTDIKWLEKFTRLVKRKKDPLSRFYKKEKKSKGWRIFLIILFAILFLGSVAALILLTMI